MTLPSWLDPLPDAAAMRAADGAAIEAGAPGIELMERAARGLGAPGAAYDASVVHGILLVDRQPLGDLRSHSARSTGRR